jgi:hypothetical protein
MIHWRVRLTPLLVLAALIAAALTEGFVGRVCGLFL